MQKLFPAFFLCGSISLAACTLNVPSSLGDKLNGLVGNSSSTSPSPSPTASSIPSPSPSQPGKSLHPPSWIIGTWGATSGSIIRTDTFSSDDWTVTLTNGNTTVTVDEMASSNVTTLSDSTSGNVYTLNLVLGDGERQTVTYAQNSNGTISYALTDVQNGVTTSNTPITESRI